MRLPLDATAESKRPRVVAGACWPKPDCLRRRQAGAYRCLSPIGQAGTVHAVPEAGQRLGVPTAVRRFPGLMSSPFGLRCSLRWPSRSSFAKCFSFALEPKYSLTLPFLLDNDIAA